MIKEADRMLLPEPLSFPQLYEEVREALRLWHNTGPDNPLGHLVYFRSHRQDLPNTSRNLVNQLLLNKLESLEITSPELAQVISMRYLDGMKATVVAHHMTVSTANLSRLQKQAITRLAELIQEDELTARQELYLQFQARLAPPSYDCLFGIENPAQVVSELLQKEDGIWLISVEGIGGIGKTSLANVMIRRAIVNGWFEDFGWISARSQRFQLTGKINSLNEPALTADALLEQLATQILGDESLPQPISAKTVFPILKARFQSMPHLVVIDNLETVSDIESLLPILQQLSNPSKFLITSRESLYSEVATFPYRVPALTETSAIDLIRHEAGLRNQPRLQNADDEELQSIYEIVGGNPLALRLIVGQTRVHQLDVILQDLKKARGQAIENLYTYIYRFAWDSLDEVSRRALLAMPFASTEGGLLEDLAGICKLEPGELRSALNELVRRNLVNNLGDYTQSRYAIHSLTRTFLMKQVAKWTQ
ncbi:MAG: NB-ARC domain-containing protein [Chloroflexota bacterium]